MTISIHRHMVTIRILCMNMDFACSRTDGFVHFLLISTMITSCAVVHNNTVQGRYPYTAIRGGTITASGNTDVSKHIYKK